MNLRSSQGLVLVFCLLLALGCRSMGYIQNLKNWFAYHGQRLRLCLLAAVLFIGALALWNLAFMEPLLPGFSPLYFAASGTMVVAFIIFPWHYRLYQLAGSMALVAFMSRVAAVYLRWAWNDELDGWRSIFGMSIYLLMCVYQYVGWNEIVGPWHRSQAAARRARMQMRE